MDQNKAIKHRATGINYKIDGLGNLSRIRGTEFLYRLEIALVVLVLGSSQLSKEKERGTRKKLIVQGFYLGRPPNSQWYHKFQLATPFGQNFTLLFLRFDYISLAYSASVKFG